MKIQTFFSGCLILCFLGLGAESQAEPYLSDSVFTLEANDGTVNEPPVNPLDPNQPIIPLDPNSPELKGPLSISYVSNIMFGQQRAYARSETYNSLLDHVETSAGEVIAVPNFVQINDHRGTNSGWQLFVKQEQPFINGTHVLEGTELVFCHPVISSVSNGVEVAPRARDNVTLTGEANSQLVLEAPPGKGMGTWLERFGETKENASESIMLRVPGKSGKKAGHYTTSLIWELSDIPNF